MMLRRRCPALFALLLSAVLAAAGGYPRPGLAEDGAPAPPPEGEKVYSFVPLVSYSNETSGLAGVMMVRAHRWDDAPPDTRPNTIALSGFYTLKSQYGVGLAPSVYLKGEEYLINPIFYVHRSPATFWGVGNKAGEHSDQEDFTANGVGFLLTASKRIYDKLRCGPTLWYGSARMSHVEQGGLLDRHAVDGSEGGTDIGTEILLEWDSRDTIYSTSSGTFARFTAGWHRGYLGSDFDYEDYTLDLRHFFPLGAGQVVGVQVKMREMSGSPPFYRLASLGGIGMMRGLYEGRFRDKTMAAAQIEYRVPVWKRLGAAVFGGLGEVAEKPADFTAANVRFAGGAGLRLVLDPKEHISLRLDVGVSDFGVAPMMVITEAF
jgi:hypothetical protein